MNGPRIAARQAKHSKDSMRRAIPVRRLNSPGSCSRAFFRNYL